MPDFSWATDWLYKDRTDDIKEVISAPTKEAEKAGWTAFAASIGVVGYSSTAYLINHSLEENPSDVYLNQWSYEAKLIKDTQKYQDAINSVIADANANKQTTINKSIGISFESPDNKDLFVGIHSATLKLNGSIDENGYWNAQVELVDYFDFDYHPEKVKDLSFSSGAWAVNNVAAYSNNNGVINSFWIHIDLGTVKAESWNKEGG